MHDQDPAGPAAPSILVLPDFPWPDTGTGQRSRLFLEAAAALGPVHVALLSDRLPEDAARHLPLAASIDAWGSGSLQVRGLARHVPHGALRLLAPERFYRIDPRARGRLSRLIQESGARAVLFRYAPAFCAAGAKRRADLAVLVDIDDRDDQKYETRLRRIFGNRLGGSALLRLPLARLAGMLRDRLSDASLMWFAGGEDVWQLDGVRTAILPNVPAALSIPADLPPPSRGDSVLFVGLSNHVPNQHGVRWFLDHCWPELARRFPDFRLRIVGRGPFWPDMAARYPGIRNVDFVGPVEDLDGEYARARLCICPVQEGGGSKIKVVEAAAYGRPVVGVPHAYRGFEATILDHAASALSPEDFIAACAGFLADPAAADRDGAALAQWQRQHYSRDGALARIRADILSVLP